MSLINLIDLPVYGDGRGDLSSLEVGKDVPFDIERVYYLYNLGESPRGFHAHRYLQQLAICVNGHCKFLLDDGTRREEVVLTKPNQGLLIRRAMWREMREFSNDCVILVLASAHYDEKDYIRNYSEFLSFAKGE